MAPFRPTNINKRSYPGNGNIVGIATRPSCVYQETQCCSCISTLCGSACLSWTLGCKNQPASCACCKCCCCCQCNITTRVVPGGMWKTSEQLTYCGDGSWGITTSTNFAPVGFCASNGTITGGSIDCKGYYVRSSGGYILVAPSGTETNEYWKGGPDCSNWCSICNAYNCSGSLPVSSSSNCSWFVPPMDTLGPAGYPCRSYWDSYTNAFYWSGGSHGYPDRINVHNVATGDGSYNNYRTSQGNQNCNRRVRSFRIVQS